MKFSTKVTFELFVLLIILNFVLRCHPAHHEMGVDSLEMHILANSLSEFGESMWWHHPLSILGMYPNSYASALPFIISGVSQCSAVDIEKVMFIYGIIFAIFTIFGSYILAGMFYDDDFFKFVVAFCFSTSQGILTYTTWTANARSLFIILLPLLLYTLLQCGRKHHLRFSSVTAIIVLLLLSTHHLFFYLIPLFAAYFVIISIYKLGKYLRFIKIPEKLMPSIVIGTFCLMLAFPFMTHKFMATGSRWMCLAFMFNEYPRYIGIPIFLSVGGFIYLIFKPNKRFVEWFLLVALMFFSIFVFDTMYMKWFIIIFAILLAGVGFMNLKRLNGRKKKYGIIIIFIFLLSSACFSGFFQFLHEYREKRYIEEDIHISSLWVKGYLCGRGICNDRIMGWKVAAISGLPFLTGSESDDQAYGFVDVSEYELVKNPFTSEEFWKDAPYVRISGESSDGYWHTIMKRECDDQWGSKLVYRFNISYFVENTATGGAWRSHHGYRRSEFVLSMLNKKNCIYNNGNIKIFILHQK